MKKHSLKKKTLLTVVGVVVAIRSRRKVVARYISSIIKKYDVLLILFIFSVQ